MANRIKFTLRARARFIEALRATANISSAARSINMSRRALYDARDRDPDFAAQWDDAIETAVDALEEEAWRRGVLGVEEPIISMGKPVRDEAGKTVVIRKYSDHLLLALLKAHRPERYRENINLNMTNTVELGVRLDAAQRRLGSLNQAETLTNEPLVLLKPGNPSSLDPEGSAGITEEFRPLDRKIPR
jgi:hypothetical protein